MLHLRVPEACTTTADHDSWSYALCQNIAIARMLNAKAAGYEGPRKAHSGLILITKVPAASYSAQEAICMDTGV